MKIAASSRTLVVGLALAGSVGLGGALAASAATGTPSHSAGSVSMAGQGLDTTAETTTAAGGTTRTGSAVGRVEASRIAALVGHGHVTRAEEESSPTGLAYEVTVVRPDGTERTVTVDQTTGRVLANALEDASDANEVADRPDATGDTQGRDQTGSETGAGAQ